MVAQIERGMHLENSGFVSSDLSTFEDLFYNASNKKSTKDLPINRGSCGHICGAKMGGGMGGVGGALWGKYVLWTYPLLLRNSYQI